jgi:hypothetical protein
MICGYGGVSVDDFRSFAGRNKNGGHEPLRTVGSAVIAVMRGPSYSPVWMTAR